MRTVTDDVIAILKAGDLNVGDATGAGLKPPFVVVYPLGQTRDGSHADPWEDVDKRMQITCEGVSRQQAEWLADRCDELLLASHLVIGPSPRPEVRRDDTTGGPSRFKAWPRYQIRTYSPEAPDG